MAGPLLRYDLARGAGHRAARAAQALLLLALPAAAQQPASPVVVAPVVERDVRTGRAFVGTAAPVRASTVGSEVEGKVLELLVDEGDRVEAGRLLGRLKATTAELQLAQARADFALAREQLAELENGSRPEEIAQARARLRAAEAAGDYADWKLASTRKLFDEKTVSEEELQVATAAARMREQERADAAAALELAEKG
ncbi:MAG: biotin/lipoyl-binding protein, partial [Planctomycetota bacterium]